MKYYVISINSFGILENNGGKGRGGEGKGGRGESYIINPCLFIYILLIDSSTIEFIAHRVHHRLAAI